MALADWSSTAANNGTVLGVNIAENCPAANMNNALRQAMADVAGGINISILGSFLASTSLANARSALGVASPTSNTSLTNLGNLTNAANKVPYMTGSDAWATTDFPSFGRSLVGSADAATALALLGITGSGAGTGSFSANSFNVAIPLGTGGTLRIQGGTGTIGADSTTTITFPTAFSVAPVCVVSGGGTGSQGGDSGDVHPHAVASTTGIAISNSNSDSCTYNWIAVGKS